MFKMFSKIEQIHLEKIHIISHMKRELLWGADDHGEEHAPLAVGELVPLALDRVDHLTGCHRNCYVPPFSALFPLRDESNRSDPCAHMPPLPVHTTDKSNNDAKMSWIERLQAARKSPARLRRTVRVDTKASATKCLDPDLFLRSGASLKQL